MHLALLTESQWVDVKVTGEAKQKVRFRNFSLLKVCLKLLARKIHCFRAKYVRYMNVYMSYM